MGTESWRIATRGRSPRVSDVGGGIKNGLPVNGYRMIIPNQSDGVHQCLSVRAI